MADLKKIILILVAVVWFVPVTVSAAIININSKNSPRSNPVSVLFSAGTYSVTPIGIADGGQYNAWNAWIGWPNPPSYAGWLNRYGLFSDEFDIYLDDNIRYSTSLEALANAQSTSFTLTDDAMVNFYINDNPGDYGDNVGGMSLQVTTSVPEPGVIFLFASGMIYIIKVTVKRRG